MIQGTPHGDLDKQALHGIQADRASGLLPHICASSERDFSAPACVVGWLPLRRERGVQVLALHAESSSWQGLAPCDWLNDGLVSLTLRSNADVTGPLPLCYRDFNPDYVLFDRNSESAPTCGSGSQSSKLSAALPVCSSIDGVATVRKRCSLRALRTASRMFSSPCSSCCL